MSVDEQPELLQARAEEEILARILGDSELLGLFESLGASLLGEEFFHRVGPEGRRFVLQQIARMVPQLEPRFPELEPDEIPPRLSRLFVFALYALASSALPVRAAVAEGHAPLANALGQQLLGLSDSPPDWIPVLRALRDGRTYPGIVGRFPGLGSDAFNVLLVTVLAIELRAAYHRP